MRSHAQSVRNRLAALEKRAAWIEERIVRAKLDDRSWERQELSALKWAIPLLRGMFAEVLASPSAPAGAPPRE